MNFEWHDLVGSLGVVLVLAAYVALQLSKLSSEALTYSMLNAVGSGLILVSLSFEFNFSGFLIETAWFVISLVGIALFYIRKKEQLKDLKSQ